MKAHLRRSRPRDGLALGPLERRVRAAPRGTERPALLLLGDGPMLHHVCPALDATAGRGAPTQHRGKTPPGGA